MKLLFSILAFLFSMTSIAQKSSAAEKGSYETDHYSIQYPKDWTLESSKKMGTAFILYAPESNSDFRENINMLTQDLKGKNTDLKKYQNNTEAQISAMGPGASIISSEIVSVNNTDCYKAIYTLKQQDKNLKCVSVCYISNEIAYLITFTAVIDNFNEYASIAGEIMDSFKLKE